MKILTLILFGIAFKSEVIGQKTIYKDNFGEISIVTYGLVDESTVVLIKELISDTNNFIVYNDFSYLLINSLFDRYFALRGGESPLCEKSIEPILTFSFEEKQRFKGFNLEEKYLDFYFKSKNHFIYDGIIKSLPIKNLDSCLVHLDSITKMDMVNTIISEYSLSSLDSLILKNELNNIDLTKEDLIKIGMNKRIINLYSLNTHVNGYEDFIKSQKVRKNVFFILPRSGSRRSRSLNYLIFKNRIKGHYEDFSIIETKDVPKKITFSKYTHLKKTDLVGFNFIFISELKNCTF